MADLLPTNFPNQPSGAIPTYNSFDLTKGTGQVVFYPIDLSGSNTLVTDQIYGHKGYNQTAGSFVDYAVKFERPITLLGTFLANIQCRQSKASAGSGTASFETMVNLVISGSTTSRIVASGSAFYTEAIAGSSAEIVETCQGILVDIDDPERVRRGEYIVLRVQNTYGATGSMGSDPKGRQTFPGDGTQPSWTVLNAQSVIIVPVRTEFTG